MKRSVAGILSGLICAHPALAANISEEVHWFDGDRAGQKAATCLYHTPDRLPFAEIIPLVVDNAQPYGTRLWSWDYATFLPDYTLSCVGSGISNSTPRLRDAAHDNPANRQLCLTVKGGDELMPTTNPGVGIRWHFRTAQGESVKNQPQLSACASLEVSTDSAGRYIFNPRKVATLSAKAELVKTAEVVYGTAISPLTARSQLWLDTGAAQSSSVNLGLGGITPIAPACRLSTKAYQVEMGRWVIRSQQELPARGAQTPFELQLECTGQVAHLRLRLEDSGTQTSAQQNIVLYRHDDSKSIEGLEIEMLLNGKRIHVGDGTPVDAGAYGSNGQNNSLPVYRTAAPLALTARYVQYAAITSDGKPYTGSIKGKVNIWVTYD